MAILSGCHANTTTQVTLHSIDNGRLLQQTFTRAYATRNQAGETDLVMVAEGHDSPLSKEQREPGSAAALLPTQQAPLRQTMRIVVMWNAMPNVQADAPSTTNAVIDWYIRGYNDAGELDTLHYQGAGYVWLQVGSKSIRAKIRNASISLKTRTGSGLADPLGHCTLSGTVVALIDSASLQRELDQTTPDGAVAGAAPTP